MSTVRTLYELLCDFNQEFGMSCPDLSSTDKQDDEGRHSAAAATMCLIPNTGLTCLIYRFSSVERFHS